MFAKALLSLKIACHRKKSIAMLFMKQTWIKNILQHFNILLQ